MSDDDLTIAYWLGAEQLRKKLHKQKDINERLEADIERLTKIVEEKVHDLNVMRMAFEDYAVREKELRQCLKWFVKRNHYDPTIASFEEAIRRAKILLGEIKDE